MAILLTVILTCQFVKINNLKTTQNKLETTYSELQNKISEKDIAKDIMFLQILLKESLILIIKVKNYTKIILANTKHFEYDISGIKIIDLSSWLLGNKIN